MARRPVLLAVPSIVLCALASVGSVARADPARPARLAPRRIASVELRAAYLALAEPLATLQRAVPRQERAWDSLAPDQMQPVSRTYRAEVWRIGARGADERARLAAVMGASLRHSPLDEVWYQEVELAPAPTVARLTSAFELEVTGLPEGQTRPPRAERPAIKALAERALALVAAHPSLTLAVAQCGWADAVGGAYHGVMIFDRTTREVVWIHLDDSWDAGE